MDYLEIPGSDKKIYPGDKIQLNRFADDVWIVCYGWYAWGNNREVCGWYLSKVQCNCNCKREVKPLNRTDLIDIFLIEVNGGESDAGSI